MLRHQGIFQNFYIKFTHIIFFEITTGCSGCWLIKLIWCRGAKCYINRKASTKKTYRCWLARWCFLRYKRMYRCKTLWIPV
jgi:hypothetical protein